MADDSAAILQAFRDATKLKRPLYLPTGTYFVGTSPLRFLLNDACFSGVTIYGDGVGLTQINAQRATESPQVLFYSDVKPCPTIYLSVKEIGFLTNTPGVGLQVGRDDYFDPVNEPELEIMVFNANTSTSAEAIRLNHVLNGELRLFATTAGAGTALKSRRTVFSYITGSFTSPGGTAVHITDNFNYGNVFMGLDMRDASTCVVSDSAQTLGNTFVGGNFSFRNAGVKASAGRRLLIMNPMINPTSPSTAADFVGKDAQGNPLNVGLTVMP